MPGSAHLPGSALMPGSVHGLLQRCRFPSPGTKLRCGVSGGADSLALLALAVAAGCEVTAVHVEHGLRPGSAAEADVVADAAGRLGAAFCTVQVTLSPGPNLEARARQARRRALGPDAATGHTMDDQAETVLINLLRGAGRSGLAAMRPGVTHPLLALRRFETQALCERLGLMPVDDPSNRDRRFLRNRVRHELLPLCSAMAGRDVVPVLARQASLMSEEADLLDALAAGVDATDAGALAAAPPALARRAVRAWLRAGNGYPPDAGAVERVLAVAAGGAPATDVAPATRVRRSRGRLSARPLAGGAAADAPASTPVPGTALR
jgi:tRNA(Ile)-lysidine synthase